MKARSDGWILSESDHRAEQLQTELAANIGALLDNNRDLSRRIMHLEDAAFDVQTTRSRRRRGTVSAMSAVSATRPGAERGITTPTSSTDTGAISTSTSGSLFIHAPSETAVAASNPVFRSVFEFESDLEASRVYRRVQRSTMDFSFRSSVAHTHAWSLLSGRSLADVSVLSVIALPLDLEDVANRHHYIDASDHQLACMTKEESSAPKLERLFAEEKSIFHKCLKIYSQLVQIPGFQEIFDTQWRAQRITYDMDVTGHCGADGKWFWRQQVDIFTALKSIFREDLAYQLLADSLGHYLDEELRPDSTLYSRTAAESKSISLFSTLCNKLNFKTCDIFHVNDTLHGDNVTFLKVSFVSNSLVAKAQE